ADEKALLDFAVKLNNHPRKLSRRDVDLLREHGFSDVHVLETVIMVGLAKFANFVSFGLGTVPDFDSSRIVRELGLGSSSEATEKVLNPSSGNSVLIQQGPVPPVSDERSECKRDSAQPTRVVDDDAPLVEQS